MYARRSELGKRGVRLAKGRTNPKRQSSKAKCGGGPEGADDIRIWTLGV